MYITPIPMFDNLTQSTLTNRPLVHGHCQTGQTFHCIRTKYDIPVTSLLPFTFAILIHNSLPKARLHNSGLGHMNGKVRFGPFGLLVYFF